MGDACKNESLKLQVVLKAGSNEWPNRLLRHEGMSLKNAVPGLQTGRRAPK